MTVDIPYEPPGWKKEKFTCPHCHALTVHNWFNLRVEQFGRLPTLDAAKISFCTFCGKRAIWLEGKMVAPEYSEIPPPNKDLNKEIKRDYLEARSIAKKSPRGAAALLRLCLDNLCLQLGAPEKKELFGKIEYLITANDLNMDIQQALHGVRVIGNEAVHPGVLDLNDNLDVVVTLFGLVNHIADVLITQPRKRQEFFDGMPDGLKRKIDGAL
ncbi:MAG: DUF4145 domain-containing protein [Pseudomonadota bacterium]